MATAVPRPRLTLVERLDAYERLMRLDKPIGTLLLVWPTLTGLWIAAQGRPPVLLIFIFTLGTLLMRSAGCAVNDVMDRESDCRHPVKSKRPRPCPTPVCPISCTARIKCGKLSSAAAPISPDQGEHKAKPAQFPNQLDIA